MKLETFGCGWACHLKSVVIMTSLVLQLMSLPPCLARAAETGPMMPVTTALPLVAPTAAKAAASAFAQVTGSAVPTPAGAAFCQQMPSECAIDLSEPTEIPFTIEVQTLLQTTSDQVNAAIKPMSDMAHWGVEDRWDFPNAGYGDCEGFQLLKRRRLIEGGVPRRVLRMAVVLDQNSKGHAVLMVRTTAGDLVLDNKTSEVLSWWETDYRFIKREGQDGLAWVSLLEPNQAAAGIVPIGSLR